MRNGFLAAALVIAACASGPTTAEKKAGLAYQDMALKVKEICYNINTATDVGLREVETRTDNPELKRQTIQWRMYTLTHCRQAVINPSPLSAFFDLWVMMLQRKEVLETRGPEVLGDYLPLVVDANNEVLAYIVKVANEIFPANSRDKIKSAVESYAAAHPITGTIREWQSVGSAQGDSVLKTVTSIVPSLGIKKTATSIEDVSRSIDGVGEIVQDLPHLARWNVQLLLYDLDESPSLLGVRQSARDIANSVSRFTDIADKLPERVQAEVGKTLDEIDAKQEGLRKTLDEAKGVATEARGAAEALQTTVKEAETTLASAERASAAFADAGEKWQPVLATVLDVFGPGPEEYEPSAGPDPNIANMVRVAEEMGKSGKVLQDTLAELRGILEGQGMDRLNANTRGTMDHTATRLAGVIDHATWRGAQLAIGIAVLVVLCRLVLLRLKPR